MWWIHSKRECSPGAVVHSVDMHWEKKKRKKKATVCLLLELKINLSTGNEKQQNINGLLTSL